MLGYDEICSLSQFMNSSGVATRHWTSTLDSMGFLLTSDLDSMYNIFQSYEGVLLTGDRRPYARHLGIITHL